MVGGGPKSGPTGLVLGHFWEDSDWAGPRCLYFPKMSSAKSSWPELLGLPVNAARQKILNDRPDVQVVVVPPARPIENFVTNRVFIFVNSDGNVTRIPVIG
ncbi:hypothetical protein QYE76_071241 [Lolium multiflorum]|uniref:Uncharacterized protein n=1 Tax=Lolium multiflorum TaxID=4521 RepID=A0AAD8SJQ3_LOLMU|nr:hypothetical protein QYE76_071241 [Lolium multiflorum]